MQARTRTLTPLLPAFVAAGNARRDWGTRLLAAAQAASEGERFVVDGVTFARVRPHPRSHYDAVRASQLWAEVMHIEPGSRAIPLQHGPANITKLEHDAFWAWAIVETLRHTGIRIEELLELTQLSLRHYTPASTNTLVPLLHIVPSKTDAERLIPMSPELVTVLLAVQRRGKNGHAHLPLSVRYDPHEKTHGQPLPHLFARRVGTRHQVISLFAVRNLLNATADWAGLTDNGQPVRFTPHDFRRLFTTKLVGAGAPPAHRRVPARPSQPRHHPRLHRRVPRAPHHRPRSTALPIAKGRPRRLPPPLRHPLHPRTRLHPMPLPPRRPRPTRTTRADDHQRRSPTGRSPRQRLARRSRRPRGKPDPPATTAHRGRSPMPFLDRGVPLSTPVELDLERPPRTSRNRTQRRQHRPDQPTIPRR